MNSIQLKHDRYLVKTVYTANADWQNHAQWQYCDASNAVLRDNLDMSLERALHTSEMHSENVLSISDGTASRFEAFGKERAFGVQRDNAIGYRAHMRSSA